MKERKNRYIGIKVCRRVLFSLKGLFNDYFTLYRSAITTYEVTLLDLHLEVKGTKEVLNW